MDLFTNDLNINLLPYDGTVNYYGKILNIKAATTYLEKLLTTIEWKNDEAYIYGKHIITKRKVAWYGDAPYTYTYSNKTKTALLWTKELQELKLLAEQTTGETFNACLLNLYHSGEEGMTWHSDAEKEIKKNSAIASFSFGAERKFSFKHKKTSITQSVFLEHGSLLVMKDTTQSHWLHALPKTKKVSNLRINLTFRSIVQEP
jgi:alkylated DNA repair dioxygenase AlkB